MKIVKLTKENEMEVVAEAIEILKRGSAIVYPTDTCYGLGVNALDASAIKRIFKIKQRPSSKPVPLAIKNVIWAKELAYIDSKQEKILNAIWPGQVTVVLNKKSIIPDIATANQKTVGLRVPDHKFTDLLLAKFGYPITSTSANISGEEATYNIQKIVEAFNGKIYKPELVIDVGDLKEMPPSTVLDLTSDKPKILRVGPTKPNQLLKLLAQ